MVKSLLQNMKQLMQTAMPHLFVVTINGADGGDTTQMNWDRLIQPLDAGSFDTYQFVRTLKQLGYNGPIGLQHYGIKGDARENLRRSMDAWRQFSKRMQAEKELEEPRYDRYKRPPRPVTRPGRYYAP